MLASILFAAIGSSRNNARKSVCQSNLRQHIQSVLMYVDDYDGWWPTTWAWDRWSATHPGYPLCPQVESRLSAVEKVLFDGKPAYRGVPGYAYNIGLTSRPNPPDYILSREGVSSSEMPYPAVTVALLEQAPNIIRTPRVNPYPEGTFPYPTGVFEDWKRHNGGANYAFCDGHVKWYAPEQVADGDNLEKGNDGSKPTLAVFPPIDRTR